MEDAEKDLHNKGKAKATNKSQPLVSLFYH